MVKTDPAFPVALLEEFLAEVDGFVCQECGFGQGGTREALEKILKEYKVFKKQENWVHD